MTGPAVADASGRFGFDCSQDDFLGGRLSITQPRKGHRSGIEAVLIAAATPLAAGETVLDIGSGVGVAGLCALSRVAGARAVLVEADADLAALAAENARRNGFAVAGADASVDVHALDVTERGAIGALGLDGAVDHAVANPPFYDPAASRTSPAKSAAHAAPADLLDAWIRFAARAVRPGGTLTLVHRAEAVSLVLQGFGRRFGGVTILPVHPRPGAAATRILVQGRKASRAPVAILPGLVLHGRQGHGFLPEVEAVLRTGAKLEMTR
ncbi:tRNA1(Val) (adenine(37)-N6)-methyltransferase [Microbaculum marinum]|uniref:Methyltransferase n=1 Tax=Microbaculum marinum TaxID=1764581 RepID=A0AAW9RW12_9HYPH